MNEPVYPYEILRYFECEHLSPELRVIAGAFEALAHDLARHLPDSSLCAETEVALRKLLEAKDAAVRAAMSR